MKIRNPHNGQYDYDLKIDDKSKVDKKAQFLRANQKDWLQKGMEYRVNTLLQLAAEMETNKEAIFNALSKDTGRRKISRIEIEGTFGMIRGRCLSVPSLMNDSSDQRASFSNPKVMIRQQLIPYDLVGVISPWNFPLLLALIDTIPALLAGSAVLLKPSEVTPRFLDPLEESIQKIKGLQGVLSIVRGGAESGKALVDSVDAVCFTGSTETGLKIGKRCAERFIPAFLELGGKDPAIVLADADLDVAANAIMRSAAGASGQACQSLERIYIHHSVFEPLVQMLIEKSEACLFNNDYSKGGTIGPLIFDQLADKIQNQIDDAIKKGAAVRSGGIIENINGGLWIKPTVMTEVTHEMKVMSEETFGPIIPCISFENETEAIRLANDSIYGLSASVFSKDIEHAVRVAEQIEAGGISINDASLTNQVFDATKNSFKLSGINGSRMGAEGFTRFFRKKALLIQTAKPSSIHTQDEEPNPSL